MKKIYGKRHAENYQRSVEDVKIKNKIRDRFKKERMLNTSPAQRVLYASLQLSGKGRFRVAKEREIYTADGVRFADIFIKKYGLAIEVDGGYHATPKQKEKDALRAKEIWDKKKIIIVRFSNDEVLNDLKTVMERIDLLVDQLEALPAWTPAGKTPKARASIRARKEFYAALPL
jgi:very-short-patch-repair endonuclease